MQIDVEAGVKPLIPALLFSCAAIFALVGHAVSVPQTGQMAVVFPFGTNSASAVSLVVESGGSIVTTTQLANIVVAAAADEGFQGRVRAAGALFFFNAAGLCGDLGFLS